MNEPRRPLRSLRDEVTDLPNVLTLLRIASLPLVLVLIDNYSREKSFWSAVVFGIAAATDFLDGYLARKRGQVTVLGQFLDPLADKLFVLGCLVYLAAHGRVPEWLVVLLMSREIAITGLRTLAISYDLVIAASTGGKTKTALQTVGLIFLLVHFSYPTVFFGVVVNYHAVGLWLIYVSLLMSVWSFGEYLRFFVNAVEKNRQTSP